MLEKILTGAADALLKQGLSGLIIIGMALVIWWLLKDNRSLRQEANVARQEISVLQEKRIAETRETLIALNNNTSALTTLSQAFGTSRRS